MPNAPFKLKAATSKPIRVLSCGSQKNKNISDFSFSEGRYLFRFRHNDCAATIQKITMKQHFCF